jgi:hypothetical protein
VKPKLKDEQLRLSIKTFLDQNAIFLASLKLSRGVRCYFCKALSGEVSLYLNHNSIGEALILCQGCHQTYQTPHEKTAGA